MAAKRAALLTFLEAASRDQHIAAVWTPGIWIDWYTGGSRSRLRRDGAPSEFEVSGFHHVGLHWKVKIVPSNDPTVTFVLLTSSVDPGTSAEVLTAMLDAVNE